MSWKMVASLAVLIVLGYAVVPEVMSALWSIPVAIWEALETAIKAVVSRVVSAF